MSEKLDNLLSKKLNTTFSAAPKELWNKIAVDLDDTEFDNAIKNNLSHNSKKAPDFLWSGIEENLKQPDQSDAKLDEIIRSAYDKKVKAPEYIWYSIEQKLNIDRIWNNMSTELNRMKYFYLWKKRVLSWGAVAILLLFVRNCDFGFLDNKSIVKNDNFKEQNTPIKGMISTNHNEDNKSKSNHTDRDDNNNLTNKNLIKKQSENPKVSFNQKNYPKNAFPDTSEFVEEFSNLIDDKTVQERVQILNDFSNVQLKNINKINSNDIYIEAAILDIVKNKKELKINCDIGLIASSHQYVPLNVINTKTNLRNNTSAVNAVSPISFSYGLEVGVDIGSKISINTEIFYRSTIRREYLSTHNGIISKHLVDYNYFRTNLVLNSNLLKYGISKNHSVKAGIGIFFSNLQNFNVTGSASLRNFVNPEMNSWNTGMIASVSQQHVFYKHFVLEYGFRTDAGFSLIFNQNNPKNYQNINAVGTGFFAALKYKF
jgi:hypothetical protein